MTTPQRLVLLGTGTNIGKTYAACALTRALNGHGQPTLGLKPVESGVHPGEPSDASLLAEASASACSDGRPLHYLALPEPLSPHLAARHAGISVALEDIRQWVTQEEVRYNTLRYSVIETAGGAFSPLHETATNYDFAQLFPDALWILVAHDSLGVLHDLTVCLEALQRRGREPDFVLLSEARPPDASTGTNAAELERLNITRVTAVLRRDEPEGIQPLIAKLRQRAGW